MGEPYTQSPAADNQNVDSEDKSFTTKLLCAIMNSKN
jgi:hypothetical protein